MKQIETQTIINALNARRREIKAAASMGANGMQTPEVDDSVALFNAAGRLKDTYTVRVSMPFLTGSGLGDVYERARHGDHGAQLVVEVIAKVFKEAKK